MYTDFLKKDTYYATENILLVYIFLLVNLDSLPKVGGVLCSVLIMVYNMRALLGRFERPLFTCTISSRLQKVKASFHSATTAYEREG